MATLTLLTLAIVAAATQAAFPPIFPKGGFSPILKGGFSHIKGGLPPFLHKGGISPFIRHGFPQILPYQFGYQKPHLNLRKEKPMQLTCRELTKVTEKGVTLAGISAVIKEKNSFGGYGGGGHFGFPGGNFHGGGFNRGHGHGQSQGLQADFKLVDPLHELHEVKVTLILTEKGYVGQGGCKVHNFGRGLQSKRRGGHPGGRSFGFDPFSSFFGGKVDRFTPDGVVAEIKLEPGTAKHVSLHNLKSYSKIDDLAGRGLVACKHVEVEYDGTAVCKDDYSILNCCTLAYDHEDRDLHLDPYHK